MKFTQSQRGLLVISNDTFLVGVLTGYSAANNLLLHSISYSESLMIDQVNPSYHVIVLDQRPLTSAQATKFFQILKQINVQHDTAVCAIYNRKKVEFIQKLSWVKYLNDDDVITKLDAYISNIIASLSISKDDRRGCERRLYIDRRDIPANVSSLYDVTNKLADVQSDEHNERYNIGPFMVNKNSYTVYYKNKNLSLTVKEFKLFILLAEAHDHVCSTEIIIAELWPNTRRANKSDLYQYMHLLRKKVEDDPEYPHWIQTVKGVGYSLNTNEIYKA